jgi:hypothetical protein
MVDDGRMQVKSAFERLLMQKKLSLSSGDSPPVTL